MKNIFIYLLFIITVLFFISCEEPADPVVYDSIPKSIGKSINSINIFWNETTVANFKSYDVFYIKSNDITEPTHFITITHKNRTYTSITGLEPGTSYKILLLPLIRMAINTLRLN